ncbi:MAG: hypothetical protein H0U59_10980 [Gemmatimonadaceae bacterium]|nr:hypothetical protein [Gemmatimonadaceae bacterium]
MDAGSSPARPTIPPYLRGDRPCSDCGTKDNIIWWTDSVFWNAVCRSDPDYVEPILCIPCFVIRADAKGFRPMWRVIPEWPMVNRGEMPRGETTPDTEAQEYALLTTPTQEARE